MTGLLRYDLVDITKEALTVLFETNYVELVAAWHKGDLYSFSRKATFLIDLLDDMERLLASDSRFLLGNWIRDAKQKGTDFEEVGLLEWNARAQVTLWGKYTIQRIFDYACKAWSGLVEDYYMPRWRLFFKVAADALIRGVNISEAALNTNLLVNVEVPFVSSRKVYRTQPLGIKDFVVKGF